MIVKQRSQQLGEVFTPLPLVNEILDKLSSFSEEAFTKEDKTFLDPSCGNGAFLIEILKRKINHKDPLSTIYGVDIMVDNVCDTIVRLVSYTKWNIDIFSKGLKPKEDGGYNQDDHPTFDWLRENHNWTREYRFGSHKENYIYIRPNQEQWWLFEYAMNKKFTICQNIICADALRYHFRFDSSYPYDDEAQKRKQKRKEEEQQMAIYGEVFPQEGGNQLS